MENDNTKFSLDALNIIELDRSTLYSAYERWVDMNHKEEKEKEDTEPRTFSYYMWLGKVMEFLSKHERDVNESYNGYIQFFYMGLISNIDPKKDKPTDYDIFLQKQPLSDEALKTLTRFGFLGFID